MVVDRGFPTNTRPERTYKCPNKVCRVVYRTSGSPGKCPIHDEYLVGGQIVGTKKKRR